MKHQGANVGRLRIGLIGDYTPQVRAHRAIPQALKLAGNVIGCAVETEWVATETLDESAQSRLSVFDALWCVPASPYANMDGALGAIRFARERNLPFLGTCGGFQHALIEYAQNVLGFTEADHAESNPNATMPVVAALSCSLVGVEGAIVLNEGSRIKAIYGTIQAREQYHCNFGLNSQYEALFATGALRITGRDENGEARVIELDEHRFFIGTLYQPELSASAGIAHPLITAYVKAIARL